VPIPGTRRTARIQENAAATQVTLSADEHADLVARLGVHGDRYNEFHLGPVGR
jgi:aryl-alcohol dehydrogenase-like predicted oxidoreductase